MRLASAAVACLLVAVAASACSPVIRDPFAALGNTRSRPDAILPLTRATADVEAAFGDSSVCIRQARHRQPTFAFWLSMDRCALQMNLS